MILDTCAFLWLAHDHGKFSEETLEQIDADPAVSETTTTRQNGYICATTSTFNQALAFEYLTGGYLVRYSRLPLYYLSSHSIVFRKIRS